MLGHLSHFKRNKTIPILGMEHKEVIKYMKKDMCKKMFIIYFTIDLYRKNVTKKKKKNVRKALNELQYLHTKKYCASINCIFKEF